MPEEIEGTCDERFAEVGRAFAEGFEKGEELGGAVAVMHDGELVVDLWSGYADVARTRPWRKDTMVVVSSTTKTVVSLCGLMLLDRGIIELDAPIATYWPEFAAAGKAEIPVRYIFCHATGVPSFEPPFSLRDLFDWELCVTNLARQKPWWPPGTATGYHANSYGYLLGELVRRTTGRTIGQFVREEFADEIGADFWIGLPESELGRVANADTSERREIDPDSMAYRAHGWMNSGMAELWGDEFCVADNPDARRYVEAELPGHSGVCSARGLAQIGSILANGGTYGNQRYLNTETVAMAWQEQFYEHDLIMDAPTRYGLGYGLSSNEVPLPFPNALHWGGYGGSIMIIDPDSKTCWAYVPNRWRPEVLGDSRNLRISVAAVTSILALG
jgi:CubicO group peptidase (beta-lactamase class C family)